MNKQSKCDKCKSDKLTYPEGIFCPICDKEEITKLSKKYFDAKLKQ